MKSLNDIFIFYVKTNSFILFPPLWELISKFDEIYFDENAPVGILWAGQNSEWIKFENFEFKKNDKSKIFILGEKKNEEDLKKFFKKNKINFREFSCEWKIKDGILKGQIFCILRPLPDSLLFCYEIEKLGGKAIPLPLLKMKIINSSKIKNLNEKFDYLIFTSKRGVIALKEILSLKEISEFLKDKKIISIGPKTKEEIENMGFEAIIPEEYTQEGILKIFENLKRGKVLILRTEGRKTLIEKLKEMKFYVKEIKIYKMIEEDKEKINIFLPFLKNVTDFIFTSSKIFENFLKRGFEEFLKGKKITAIGKITANYIREKGYKVDLIPEKFTQEGILEILKNK